MSRDRGWVLLHRSLVDDESDIWNDREPFCKRAAWVDLIAKARYAAGDVPDGVGGRVRVQRGEFFAALRWLARRWHWKKDRVSRFLKMLETGERIMRQRELPRGSVYLVVNYEVYQAVETEARQEPRHVRDRGATKDKEGNKETTVAHPRRASWITPYADAYKARWGAELSAAKAAKPLRDVERSLGDDRNECVARWGRFQAAQNKARFAHAAGFKETHPDYATPGWRGSSSSTLAAPDVVVRLAHHYDLFSYSGNASEYQDRIAQAADTDEARAAGLTADRLARLNLHNGVGNLPEKRLVSSEIAKRLASAAPLKLVPNDGAAA